MSKYETEVSTYMFENFGYNCKQLIPHKGFERKFPGHELLLSAYVSCALFHLPFDLFAIPLLKNLGVRTKSITEKDVKYFEAWDAYYCDENIKHRSGSAQPDLAIHLKDTISFFEFKKPSEKLRGKDNIGRLAKQMVAAQRESEKIKSPGNWHIFLIVDVIPENLYDDLFEMSKEFRKKFVGLKTPIKKQDVPKKVKQINWQEFYANIFSLLDSIISNHQQLKGLASRIKNYLSDALYYHLKANDSLGYWEELSETLNLDYEY